MTALSDINKQITIDETENNSSQIDEGIFISQQGIKDLFTSVLKTSMLNLSDTAKQFNTSEIIINGTITNFLGIDEIKLTIKITKINENTDGNLSFTLILDKLENWNITSLFPNFSENVSNYFSDISVSKIEISYTPGKMELR
jgi:hypothetical protein